MKDRIVLILFLPIILMGYQNCGALDPSHGIAENSSNVPGLGLGGDEVLEQDAIIEALTPAAIQAWGNKCQNCHSNREINNFTSFGESILDGTSRNFSINANRLSFAYGNANHSMPTDNDLTQVEQESLQAWAEAVITKKELLAGSVESCRANSEKSFNPDVREILAVKHVNYQGSDRSCVDCHGNNNSFFPFLAGNDAADLESLRALSYPRKPEASILYDTLVPQDGSSPSSYHESSLEAQETIKKWIEGCMP